MSITTAPSPTTATPIAIATTGIPEDATGAPLGFGDGAGEGAETGAGLE